MKHHINDYTHVEFEESWYSQTDLNIVIEECQETMRMMAKEEVRLQNVSIASYRYSEMGPTLRSLFSTVKYPDGVSVGLVVQLEESSEVDSRIWNDVVSFRQHSQHQI